MAGSNMFPGASSLGDTLETLFKTNSSETYNQQLNDIYKQQHLNQTQNAGVQNPQNNEANISQKNSADFGNQKVGKPAQTADPQEVEARWMQRLAKFAGIAQSTSVKLGGI